MKISYPAQQLGKYDTNLKVCIVLQQYLASPRLYVTNMLKSKLIEIVHLILI